MRYAESTFDFLERIGPSVLWDEVRDLLNEWLQHHPEAEKLRPKLIKDFDPFFWELYVHALFSHLGFSAEVEREGTPNPPDYVFSDSERSLVVECWSSESAGFDRTFRVVEGALQSVPYDARRPQWLGEVLNDTFAFSGLVVALDELDPTTNQPARRKICEPVQAWIDDRPRIGDERTFTADGWSFTLAALAYPDSQEPFVGVYPAVAMDPSRPADVLRRGLRKKAKKDYLKAPSETLIFAANYPSTMLKVEEVEAALYGDDGLWSSGHSRHVNGVLLGRYVKPYSVAACLPTLWLNPDVEGVDLPFDTVRPASSGLVETEGGITARGLFDLSANWGTAEPFPGVL